MKNSGTLVYKAKSQIVSCNELLESGFGIFAKVNIAKNQYICSFSGYLVDYAETKYHDPTYIFSWQLGRGFKLISDDLDGHLGHFANSVHPNNPSIKRNAKIDKKNLKKSKSNKHLLERRMTVHIVATKDISAREEIIIDYGAGYWKTMESYLLNFNTITKPISVLERDERARKRAKQ
jgi:hypothetical protein